MLTILRALLNVSYFCPWQLFFAFGLIFECVFSVFECAYAQLVLPWYSVPGPCDSQLLHQVLWKEFDQVIDQVISRGKDFDVCAASVGCIRILTQHLHSAKQSDR